MHLLCRNTGVKIKDKRFPLAKKVLYRDNAPAYKFETAMAKIHELRLQLAPHSSYTQI